jgi:para-aminobenzoate synthetase/4-amino-4-deoxychorismate lyase
VRASAAARLVRRPLERDLTPVQALRLVRADALPVALFGSWAGGCDVVGSEPLHTRTALASTGLADVFDAPYPSGAVPDTAAPDTAAPDTAAPDGGEPAFGGGWIGYLGYSAAGEALAPSGSRRLPAWWFGYYDHVLRRDQATGQWFFEALWTAGRADVLERRYADLSQRAADPSAPYRCGPFRLVPSAAGHKAAVRQAVDYIWQGDIFQANICLRAEAGFDGDPLDAFCQAVTVLEPPYAAFITVPGIPGIPGIPGTPGGAVASLSPELFLRRTGATVVSRPIKGTARRPREPRQAARQRGDLERSAKNRAENVMIVDLVRNDLSRVCVPGSVTVTSLLGAEPHPGVWHLVSEVRGTLREGAGDGDLIRAAFPPGSVTGAPKVRALEIIDELEAVPREVYTGAIGYRSPLAGLELNVAIRTFEFAAGQPAGQPARPGTVWLGAGGGIVADSDTSDEYAECLLKAGPLVSAIGSRLEPGAGPPPDLRPRPAAGVFTSLKVTAGQTENLAAHLARLAASTRELYARDLPASLPGDLAECLARRPTGRLRVTVRPVGGPLQATVEVVPLQPAPEAVTLRPVVVPGGIGAHKWRDRRLLAELIRAASPGPAGQLLITDESGEVLETDRANLFAVTDGVLRTPPADGRILPGTTRDAIVLAARREGISCSLAPLTVDQLRAASEAFVCNAVYGILPVRSIDGLPVSWEPGPVGRHFAATRASGTADGVAGRTADGTAGGPPRPTAPRPMAPRLMAPRPMAPRLMAGPAGPAPGGPRRGRPLIILVDNYDSFTYNLAHLIEAAGGQVEVVRNDEVAAGQVSRSGAAGVVISPGPCAPADAGISVDVVRGCAGVIPLLGICLGHQAIGAAYGGRIVQAPRPVHGQAWEISHDGRGVLAGLPRSFEATRYHSLIVDERSLPSDLVITARSGSLPMGLRHAVHPVEGVQFHPESILTAHGAVLIRNFVRVAADQLSGTDACTSPPYTSLPAGSHPGHPGRPGRAGAGQPARPRPESRHGRHQRTRAAARRRDRRAGHRGPADGAEPARGRVRAGRAAAPRLTAGTGDARSRRHLGVAVPGLARRVLSAGRAAAPVAGVLRRAVRYGREQRHVLPAARPGHLRGVAPADPGRLRDGAQGQPLPHPRAAAWRPRRTRAPDARGLRRPRRQAGTGADPAAAHPRGGSGAAG